MKPKFTYVVVKTILNIPPICIAMLKVILIIVEITLTVLLAIYSHNNPMVAFMSTAHAKASSRGCLGIINKHQVYLHTVRQ